MTTTTIARRATTANSNPQQQGKTTNIYDLKTSTLCETTLKELQNYGSVATNYQYEFLSKIRIGLKIYLQINISNENPLEALVSVVRIDNVTIKKDYKLNTFHLDNFQDRLWRNIDGWNVDLEVNIFGSNGEFMNFIRIPKNPSSDLLQFKFFNSNDTHYGGGDGTAVQEIPKNIFQMGGDRKGEESGVIRKAMMLLRMQNPSYNHYIVSLEEMSSFIEKYEGIEVRKLFEQISPIAFKSDIFRLVALYNIGGVYLDSKMICLRPLDDILPEKGAMLVKERWGIEGFQSAFLASPPGNLFFRMAIDRIMSNIKDKNYSTTPISITGPRLLGSVYYGEYLPLHNEEIVSKYIFDVSGNYITEINDEKKHVINYHNGEYRRLSDSDGACNYEKMYFARIVFGEGECNAHSLKRALKAMKR